MAVKISELPAAGSVTDTDEFELNQSGTSRKATLLQVRGAATAPFDDATAVVKGSADATKLLRVEVDGFTTATTRVLTPPNRNWAPTTFGSELTEVADASAGRTKLALQALATLSTVGTSQIDAGAVTANQIYTGSFTAPAAVAGVVDINFSTLGTTVDFIMVTDVTTVNVDLTTPAVRRNLDIYNNTTPGVEFGIRDAADASIVTPVPYRHIARVAWTGSIWLGKAVLVVKDAIKPASQVDGLADIATSGSATDLTTGTIPDARVPATAVTQHMGVYVPINGTVAGSNISTITDAMAGQTIKFDQALALSDSFGAGKWVILNNVHASTAFALTSAGGTINGASSYTIPAGGEIMLRCVSNAGSAPICDARGDAATVNLGGKQLIDAELLDYSETNPSASVSGSVTRSMADGNTQSLTLTGNVTALTISNPPPTGIRGTITFILTQDGTGGRTWSDPTSTTAIGGVGTMNTAINAVNVVTYTTRNAGSTWLRFFGGSS